MGGLARFEGRPVMVIGHEKGNDTRGFQEWLSSHPSLSRRVAAAEERARQWKADNPNWQSYLRPPEAQPTAFRQYQQRAVEYAKTAPQDDTLSQAQALLAAFPQCVEPDQ